MCSEDCGDGIVVGIEYCDDGKLGCSNDCLSEKTGWVCPGTSPSQRTSCHPICGDSMIIFTIETCDDNNVINDDGCDSNCLI